jgi:anti-sigma B factor antagonist
MEIIRTTNAGVEIFEVKGRIDANTAKEFEDLLAKAVEAGTTKMIVDLLNVDYISSSGLRVFLFIAKKIEKTGFIYLCSMQPQVAQIFTISGFNNIFSIFTDQETALKNVK